MKKLVAILLTLVMVLALCPMAFAEIDDSANLTCIVSESAQGAPFSQQTWLGFERVNEVYGTQIKFVEALEASEYETQLRTMADVGAKTIFSMFDAVNLVAAEIAPEYPDVHFILIDCNETFDIPNVTSIVVDSWEPSFLAGVVAAMTTETGKVGWVGSIEIPVIARFCEGFQAGINYANETYGLSVELESTYIGSSEDTVKAAEVTKMLADNGADIVYQAANEAGLGVIQACADLGIKCIGVDKWQGDVDPCVFWSAIIAIEDGVFNAYTSYLNGELESGTINYGISNGFTIYADVDYQNLNDEVKAAVDTVMQGVADGTLDVFAY